MSNYISALNKNILLYLFIGTLTFIPLKLSLTYLFFIPLILFGSFLIYKERSFLKQILSNDLYKNWLYLLFIISLTGCFGLNPANSLKETLELGVYSSSIAIFAYIFNQVKNPFPYLLIIITAQALAGLYSIFEFIDPERFTRFFIGTVTESGQISISIFIALACCFYFKNQKNKLGKILSIFAFILIFTALAFNLKRGPLIGVAAGATYFFLKTKPKLLIVFYLLIIIPVALIPDLHYRVFNSIEHFLLRGGRADIWTLSIHLIQKFPLGIGYDNAELINQYSSYIPTTLRHFHSNILNLWTEASILGAIMLIIFCWKLIRVRVSPINKEIDINKSSSSKLSVIAQTEISSKERYLLLTSCQAAIISWFCAGLVEYNFADSEVMLVFYLVVALIINSTFASQKKSLTQGQSERA